MNVFIILAIFLVPIYLLIRKKRSSQRLPPGSLGIPVIGQSFALLRAMKSNTAEAWLEERIRKYGPISKLSLFGKPTVFMYGPAANKFIFTNDKELSNGQTDAQVRIMGDRNLLCLNGRDHRRIRNAVSSFLKPESLKRYVGKMDEEVRKHFKTYWQGKETVTVLPLMKALAFDISSSLLFGMERGDRRREQLINYFREAVPGVWSIPINLPFTPYNRSLRASEKIREMIKQLIHEKRDEFENRGALSNQDLITSLLSIRDEENRNLSEKEVIDNTMLVMIAGHDTSSVLITFMVRLLATNSTVYEAVCQEQEEIAKNKATGESLTWEDLVKMKYTWKVAMETMRMYPPVFGLFKTTLKDVNYGGYLIPKGWQIFWSSAMTHMDGNLFPEPSKFDPTRFDNQASIPPYSIVSFGGGPRICPGYEFTKIETLITVHYLITRFKWKLCCNDNFFSREPMPVPTKGLPIKIEPKTQI